MMITAGVRAGPYHPSAVSSPDVPRREALLADSALVVVTAIWGSTFVVNELVLKEAPPLLFLALRYGVAAAVLVLLARPAASRRES